jgi:hypothetical protein
MADKDYKAILARYKFKDPLGHSLERCSDYLELLAELLRLREESKESEQIPFHENADVRSD